MHVLETRNFAEAYSKALDLVYNNPDYVTSPRGIPIKECMNAAIVVEDPTSNLFTCPKNKKLTMPTGYTKKEIALYLTGTNSAELFAKASPFWDTIKTPSGLTNSAYGWLVLAKKDAECSLPQFEWACNALSNDKDTRQAYMLFNRPEHQYFSNKDVPCTLSEIFHIRNNKLCATVTMRSNDLVSGFVHDIPSFTLFQWLMYKRLKDTVYPDLELGTYTHIVYSLHLYEKDFELTKARLETGLEPNSFPLPEDTKSLWLLAKDAAIVVAKKLKLENWSGLTWLVPLRKDGVTWIHPDELDDVEWKCPANKAFYDWLLK